MKEASNFIRATGQMTQSAYCFGFHVRESENASSPQPMRFDFSPNAFARVQFRTIPRQSIDAQLSLIATHLFGYFSRLMRRMTIPNQKDGLRSSRHQAIQKSANDFPIHFIFFNHKSHPASPIYHAQHVQPIPRTRTPHHRRLPLRPPGGSRMIIASQPRFIRKPYLRPHPLGFFHNRRIFLLDPLPHPFRILLVRSPQRFLGGNSQLGQQTPHRVGAQANTIPPMNQGCDGVAGPQGKGKLILPRVRPNHRPIDPGNHAPLQQAGAASSFAGLQSMPATSPIHRQPVIDASPGKSHRFYDNFGAFPTLHPSYGSFSKFRQNFMLQLSAIHCFLIHGRYYILTSPECLYYYGLISKCGMRSAECGMSSKGVRRGRIGKVGARGARPLAVQRKEKWGL